MPTMTVRGVELFYEVVGDSGPWLAITPGGRSSYPDFVRIAEGVAQSGFRVLLYDRRNCGRSQVAFDDSESEDAVWAEDLHALLSQLGALPAFICGSSAGVRVALALYQKYPADFLALLMNRVTGGPVAARQLPINYYDPFIAAAERDGMKAVCAMDHWRERIAARPANGPILNEMPASKFIAIMKTWRVHLMKKAHNTVTGADENDLRAIKLPVFFVPGNDRIHPSTLGDYAAKIFPDVTVHRPALADAEVDYVPLVNWPDDVIKAMVDAMVSFMKDVMKKNRTAA